MEITFGEREHVVGMATKASAATPLGKLVERLRTQRGLSQNALGRAANLSNGYVTQLESGARGKRPSRDKVLALAQGLDANEHETEELLRAAGLHHDGPLVPADRPSFRAFVMSDPLLRLDQKRALITSYESYVRSTAGH